MSSICRKCGGQMPKDRNGWEQVCPCCKGEMTPREVLEKLLYENEGEPDRYRQKDIDQALSDLSEIVMGRLGITPEKGMYNNANICYGYRRAIDDVREAMLEIFADTGQR